MSSLIGDIAHDFRSTGENLNDFLYKEGRPKNGLNDLTKEELIEKLEFVRQESWDNYNKISKELGWNN